MRFSRIRFSLRQLLIAIFILAAVLALSIRFGPHIIWKTYHSDISSGVVPIPSKPLVAAQPADALVTCKIGPITFEMPKSMTNNVEMIDGVGGVFIDIYDDNRSVTVEIPHHDNGFIQQTIIDFPGKAKLTYPRLYKEIADEQSSDFWFGMTYRELKWHRWLLVNRSMISIEFDSTEYLWRSDLEGILVSISSAGFFNFDWATVDRQWEGTITFRTPTTEDSDWVRHTCATFAIDGDPGVLQNLDAANLKSTVKFKDVPPGGELSNR